MGVWCTHVLHVASQCPSSPCTNQGGFLCLDGGPTVLFVCSSPWADMLQASGFKMDTIFYTNLIKGGWGRKGAEQWLPLQVLGWCWCWGMLNS